MLYSGVDLHRRLIVICTVDESGTVLGRKSVKTLPELITNYLRQYPTPARIWTGAAPGKRFQHRAEHEFPSLTFTDNPSSIS